MRKALVLLLAGAVTLSACGGGEGGGGGNASGNWVARAGDQELTVPQEVDLLSQGSSLPDWQAAAREMANLWVDYTLLAKAAMEDTTMTQLDVSPMVEDQVEQVILTAFRDSVIKVDPSIADPDARNRARAAAESTYVSKLEEQADPRIAQGAVEVVRQLARDPEMELSENAAERPLVTYDGGTLTAGEVREFLRSRPPPFRSQVAQAPDSMVESGILHLLTRRQLLLAAARRQGWQVQAKNRPPLENRSRQIIRSAARELGLLSIDVPSGQSREQAIDGAVNNVLGQIVRGERNATNLGAVSTVLRKHYRAEISRDGIDRVVSSMMESR